MQLRWSHAFVHVRDVAAMVAFYTEVLGFEVTDRGEAGGRTVVFLSQVPTDHHQLAFLGPAADATASEEQPLPASRVGHFAFRVEALAEVQALHRRLQADARVETVNPITHGNAWSLYFADPEGNGIEVFCDSPWHVRQPQGGAWDPAAAPNRIRETTAAAFADAPGFEPIEDYYAKRASQLAGRRASRGATDSHAGS